MDETKDAVRRRLDVFLSLERSEEEEAPPPPFPPLPTASSPTASSSTRRPSSTEVWRGGEAGRGSDPASHLLHAISTPPPLAHLPRPSLFVLTILRPCTRRFCAETSARTARVRTDGSASLHTARGSCGSGGKSRRDPTPTSLRRGQILGKERVRGKVRFCAWREEEEWDGQATR